MGVCDIRGTSSKGMLLFGDPYWGSPIVVKPHMLRGLGRRFRI